MENIWFLDVILIVIACYCHVFGIVRINEPPKSLLNPWIAFPVSLVGITIVLSQISSGFDSFIFFNGGSQFSCPGHGGFTVSCPDFFPESCWITVRETAVLHYWGGSLCPAQPVYCTASGCSHCSPAPLHRWKDERAADGPWLTQSQVIAAKTTPVSGFFAETWGREQNKNSITPYHSLACAFTINTSEEGFEMLRMMNT